ncbi:MAG: TFIIB-type zinc finger domain-containing protein [Oscillospiraceae bacterium]|nr:TFIIB-type zinc finger domain-containing protein [Oscillospiraceae bacterium]
MKQLICEMCGGTDLVKQEGFFVCQNCQTKYSVEEARKMMMGEDGGEPISVKVDTSKELENLLVLARRARDDGNSENAEKYYSQVLVKDPSSWEANFYATYFQSMQCKIGEIQSAANRLTNCEDTVLKLIKENVTDPDEQMKTVDEVAARLIRSSKALFNSYKNHYDGISYTIQGRFTQEYVNACAAARDIVYYCGDYIIQFFGDDYGKIAAACWKVGIEEHSILVPKFANRQVNIDKIKAYEEKVKKYDPDYQAPPIYSSSSGCYVATCVYGSYDCPEVWTLRRYRDTTLAGTWYGRAFVRTYYAVSPTIVKLFGETAWFKRFWRGKLDHMVNDLQRKGVESTPYQDRNW